MKFIWAMIWWLCMAMMTPFVIIVRLSAIIKIDYWVSIILWPLMPISSLAAYAYKRTFD